MIINKDDLAILELFPVEVVDGKIKVSLRNRATLTLSPELEDGVVTGYSMEYLTGKENKSIDNLQKKIEDLKNQVANIKNNGGNDTDNEDENEVEKQDENEVEKQDVVSEIVTGTEVKETAE